MIERYSRPEMAAVWNDERRIRRMLEVEAALLEVLAEPKRIPAREIRELRKVLSRPLYAAVKAKEEQSAHDVVAMIEAVSEALGPRAPAVVRYLHYGLTSSDVLDTALALQLKEASDILAEGLERLRRLTAELALRHRRTWMAGRTHGVHAEPITFGFKLAGWHAELVRCQERLRRAKEAVSFGKLSGAVGMHTQLSPKVEEEVCRRLGLRPEPASTQVVPRDRHAEYLHALALSAGAIERFATEIRHLQRTEVLEAEEPFGKGQKGSSAMPHKRNPILCENLCGLARLLRSYHAAVLEDTALWHERDISHSSVERVVLPDAAILLDFMLARFARVLEGLEVHPERMKENLARSHGLVFSQRVLLALIDKGLGRVEAYAVVQRCAMACWRRRVPFRRILAADPDVRRLLGVKGLDACFDLESYGASLDAVFRRAGLA
ncbi:MAG TPA: adenylosuccinate lyase [Elusimicrobia bacterium]|nr:adenylosuccinate lyase [Elusimicrobiota bacterium]